MSNFQSFAVADGDTFGDLLSKERIRSRQGIKIGLLTGGFFEYWRMYPGTLKEMVETDNRVVLDRLSTEQSAGGTQDHVLGDGERRHQPELLVDHSDAGRQGVCRRPEPVGGPLHPDLALIGTVDAGQDVHEGRLAGAVLAEHCVDAAAFDP